MEKANLEVVGRLEGAVETGRPLALGLSSDAAHPLSVIVLVDFFLLGTDQLRHLVPFFWVTWKGKGAAKK